jgi:hypothetical protein
MLLDKKRLALTMGILAGLLIYKIWLNGRVTDLGIDGSYYLDVAAHVRDGDGLVSDASLYHSGFTEFPYHTPVQPLWPLVLGLVARLVPLDVAAIWLPTLLYFLGLFAAWKLLEQLEPKPLIERWPVLSAGHIFITIFGLCPGFMEVTSKPYTEGLAFFILFTAFGRWHRYLLSPTLLLGLEAGGWLGLLLLLRSQMIVQAAGFAVAAGLLLLQERFKPIWSIFAVIAGFLLAILPQWLHLKNFIENPGLGDFLWFERYKVTPGLSTLQLLVKTDGIFSWLLDRATGIPVAFDWRGTQSYFEMFGPFYLVVVLVLPFCIAFLVKNRTWLISWIQTSEARFPILVVGSGLIWFLSIHALHKASFREWNFALRHSLPCILLFFSAWLFLARQGGLPRFLAWLLVGGFLIQGFWVDEKLEEKVSLNRKEKKMLKSGVAFVENHSNEVICSSQAQRLAALTDGARFHGLYPGTAWSDLRILTQLGCRWVLLPSIYEDSYQFMEGPDFGQHFKKIEKAAENWNVYTLIED